MFVDEVVNYWKVLIQEPDDSSLSYSLQSAIMRMAYGEFRTTVNTFDLNYYAQSVTIAPGGTTYDLGGTTSAVRILGPTPTHTRMSRLVSISDPYVTANYHPYPWQGVNSIRALTSYDSSDGNYRKYFLQGTLLNLSAAPAALTIQYIPVEAISWTIPAPPNVFIDDLVEYHDLIALYAARRYYAIDASTNKRFDLEIAKRESQLKAYFSQKRVQDAQEIQREAGW